MSNSSDTPTYSLPHIEANPGDFLGPAVVAVFLQALQTGYIIAQVFRFCEHVDREPRWICALVAFVCGTAFFQTAAVFSSQWIQFVIGFADWIGVIVPNWPQRVQSIMSCHSSFEPAPASTPEGFAVLMRLIVVVWEAAVPPTACAMVSVVMYIFLRNTNFWDLTFQSVIGKLYVMSLLITLCARASISLEVDQLPTHFPTISDGGPPHSFDVHASALFAGSGSVPSRLQVASAAAEPLMPLGAPQKPVSPTLESQIDVEEKVM
ncbi:hypothetical protein K488DRAFT_88403 [Vararia minispora EC-137]|uniref:Uncharacterized protein n=1 Tax=Vararia minispora EC-137 TaxID=1314806 RepID=A0ACB8QDT9_9AGAM|nr:hypothetical protein K488DRAFT_88403 [Vararia minispora EC-137]